MFLSLLFLYFWRARQLTQQTKLWFKTPGRIKHCEWTTYQNRIWPQIEYDYHVGDQVYTSEQFFIDTIHNNLHGSHARNLAFRIVSAYKEDEDIDVFYNPYHPEQAVLDTTVPWKLNLILGIIAAFFLVHMVVVMVRLYY